MSMSIGTGLIKEEILELLHMKQEGSYWDFDIIQIEITGLSYTSYLNLSCQGYFGENIYALETRICKNPKTRPVG